jgi:hypothetical protein
LPLARFIVSRPNMNQRDQRTAAGG